MRDDRAFLNDILERIQLTEEFIQPGKDDFFTSRLIQEADVIYQIIYAPNIPKLNGKVFWLSETF